MLYLLVNEESGLIYDDLEGLLGWVDGIVGVWMGVLVD